MKETAIVLLSGGMDSAVCLAKAIEMGFEPAALHLNYGQRTQQKEADCFNKLCTHYNVKYKLVVDINYLAQIGGSSLTDFKIDVPLGDTDSSEIPNSYVPFRNANILAISTSWAEVIGAKGLFIGATEADFSGYPDCRKSFFDAFQQVINFGTKPETQIQIYTPLINMTKSEIAIEGNRLNVPFEYTWSCYKSQEKACGNCDSCLLRQNGFAKAGLKDPIEYEI